MDIHIRIDAPKGGLRRFAMFVALPLALVAVTAAVASATLNPAPSTWAISGKPISASSLAADLTQLDSRLAALEAEKAPVITAWTTITTPVICSDGTSSIDTSPLTTLASWRRVGDTAEVRIRTGTAGGSLGGSVCILAWNLDAIGQFDDTKWSVTSFPIASAIGSAELYFPGSTPYPSEFSTNINVCSVTASHLGTASSIATVHCSNGTVLNTASIESATTSAFIDMTFTYPVQGWTLTGP